MPLVTGMPDLAHVAHERHLCVDTTAAGGNAALLAFARRSPQGGILCLFNFTESWQQVSGDWLRFQGVTDMRDILSDATVTLHDDMLALPPYGRVWLS